MCTKLPSTEWSGVLFYSYTGSKQEGNLRLVAEDFLLLDIHSHTYTEFSLNNNEVANYAVDNDLIFCNMGLIHSHNSFNTFFSGTDLNTLQVEGSERNHFLSLIVNNAGDYTARLTTKIVKKAEGTMREYTKTFNNNEFQSGEGPVYTEKTYVSHSNCNITVEPSLNEIPSEIIEQFNKLDAERQKTTVFPTPTIPTINGGYYYANGKWHGDIEVQPKETKKTKEAVLDDYLLEMVFASVLGFEAEEGETYEEFMKTLDDDTIEMCEEFYNAMTEEHTKVKLFLGFCRGIDDVTFDNSYDPLYVVNALIEAFELVPSSCRKADIIMEVLNSIKTSIRRLQWKSTLF